MVLDEALDVVQRSHSVQSHDGWEAEVWMALEGKGVKGGRVFISVTPDFPKETKCKPICMPGSSFMQIMT
jgi:hypothetical protein